MADDEGPYSDRLCSRFHSLMTRVSNQRTVRPARCLVKGFPIEELDWSHNFRRSYDMGFTEDVEDKAIVLSYVLGFSDLSLRERYDVPSTAFFCFCGVVADRCALYGP